MKTSQTVSGCCHACQRQWSIELVAALREDINQMKVMVGKSGGSLIIEEIVDETPKTKQV